MDNESPNLDPELAGEYVHEANEQLDQIVDVIARLSTNNDNQVAWREVFRLLHAIEGAVGMLGLAGLGELIRLLDRTLKRHQAGTQLGDVDLQDDCMPYIDLMRQCHRLMIAGDALPSRDELVNQLKGQ